MTEFKNILVIDLTKLGAAYSIINSFVDGVVVHVFEVSPIGTGAVLILASKDIIALKFIEKETTSFFKADVLSIGLIENISEELIAAYLSQNTPKIAKNLLVIEEKSFAKAFQVGFAASNKAIKIVDFRVIRTSSPNLILTFSDDSIEKLNQLSGDLAVSKFTVIEKIQPTVKAFFETLIN
ncbi:MAG: hypothetical protein WA160_08180 [Pseudobdellovibrio sp.]